MKCKVCKRDVHDLRFGCCHHCVEAENIIMSGLDSNHKGPKLMNGERAFMAMMKVQFLIEKGWTPPNK